MEREYSVEIAEVIKKFLVENDWRFMFDEKEGVFTVVIGLKSKLESTRCEIRVGEDSFINLAGVKFNAPEEARDAVCEFITRANYGLLNGNFEMDFEDGEIRYKSWCNCDDMLPTVAIVRDAIVIPALMLTRFGDGLAAVIFGMKTPLEAIEEIRAKDNND